MWGKREMESQETQLGDGHARVRALGKGSKRDIIVKLRLTELESIEVKKLQEKLKKAESAPCFYWLLEHKDAILEAEEYKSNVRTAVGALIQLLDLGR